MSNLHQLVFREAHTEQRTVKAGLLKKRIRSNSKLQKWRSVRHRLFTEFATKFAEVNAACKIPRESFVVADKNQRDLLILTSPQ
jgi:hypothetical protein